MTIAFELPALQPEPPPTPPPPDVDIPPEAFGARQIAGLMPEALDDPLYRQEMATANATRVEELNNDFIGRQREILHTGPDAFYDRRGRDAVLGAPDVIGRLQAVQDDLLGQTSTPSQRAILSKVLHSHMAVTHHGIGDHVGRQSREWQKGVAQSRIDHLHEQARHHYDDHDLIETFAGAGESAAVDQVRLAGLKSDSETARTRVASAHSAIWRTAIEHALMANSHRAASTLYDRAGDRLALGDAAILQPQLKAAAEIETAQEYLGKIVLPPAEPAAFFDAPRLLAEAEAAHQAMMAQNATDWADNPSQRATNQHYIDVQFGQRRRGIEQAKAQLDGAVADWLTQPMPDGQPQTNRPPLALWTQLSPDDQNAVDTVLVLNARAPEVAQSAGLASDPNVIRVGAPDDDVQLAQQQPQTQPRQGGAAPQPRPRRPDDLDNDKITQLTEKRREEALAQLNKKYRQKWEEERRKPIWDRIVRTPAPEIIDPRRQQGLLPDDWEGTINKIDSRYGAWTRAAAQKYGIPPELLARLLYKESNYDKTKVSNRGARGIAQLTPIAVRAVGLNSSTFDYHDPKASIDAGAAYLAQLHKSFKDWPQAAAAYNFGPTALRNWLGGSGLDFEALPYEEQRRRRWQDMKTYLQYIFRGQPAAFD